MDRTWAWSEEHSDYYRYTPRKRAGRATYDLVWGRTTASPPRPTMPGNFIAEPAPATIHQPQHAPPTNPAPQPQPTIASQEFEELELLYRWFPNPSRSTWTRFTEIDVCEISRILERSSHKKWSHIPRIYITLRMVNQLQAIDSFLVEGLSDRSFPFSERSLPEELRSHSARLQFLELQSLVCHGPGFALENEDAPHGHFRNSDDVPLRKIGELGRGGFGSVDRVQSTISYRVYARKIIPRGRTFRKDKEVLKAFEQELGNLKQLSQSHDHIIRLVGSYTDPKNVCIIMDPVADSNLEEFLCRPTEEIGWQIRPFFGCLAAALSYLHNNRIRHKDIKPQNVLVKDQRVILTDFGLALDWTELGRSTTTGQTCSTPRYASPEVAMKAPRNSSSDIWSLGCVFLEMWTVLKNQTLENLRVHMTTEGTTSPFYRSNEAAISSWIERVKILGQLSENVPSTWIIQMLDQDSTQRCSSNTLLENIREYSVESDHYIYCGDCCMYQDDSAESVGSGIDEIDVPISATSRSTSLGITDNSHNPETPLNSNTSQAATSAQIPVASQEAVRLQYIPKEETSDRHRGDEKTIEDGSSISNNHSQLPSSFVNLDLTMVD